IRDFHVTGVQTCALPILPDWTSEDDALTGVAAGALDEPLGIPDALCGNKNSFGIHAREDVAEPLPLLPDQVLYGNLQVVEKELCSRVVHHDADRADGEASVQRVAHIRQKNG